LYRGLMQNVSLRVTVLPNATIHFRCEQDGEVKEFTGPRLSLPDYASLKVALTWGGEDGIKASVNGKLLNEIKGSDHAVKLTSSVRLATGLREPLTAIPSSDLTLQEERLVRSLLELQERIAHAARIHLLEASVILRRIMLDARPLAH